ncbi:MAG: hypothetical protein E7638_08365 [Ruminococcaceae bacterium]|nr:hypothetical protein [Oscillospiraceae bacterium]
MKRFLTYILIYGISLALSLKLGGIYIGKASLTPLFMIGAAVFMALLWRSHDAPDTINIAESSDVTLTDEEERTMLFAASKTLYASVPLQILLIFTWHPVLKSFFSVLVFFFGITIGLHLGRRKIRSSVYERMNKTSDK